MDFSLNDRYLRDEGTIYLTGVQALVRVLIDRARQDRARGLRTGSPRWAARAVDGATASAAYLDAGQLARQALGDEQYANMVLVGVAYQRGALPLTAAAIEQAINHNDIAVPANIAAFRLGRQSVSGAGQAEIVAVDVRRLERELISEYREAVEDALRVLRPASDELVARIAALPDMIRGYEDVKMANVTRYRAELATLRAELASSAAAPAGV